MVNNKKENVNTKKEVSINGEQPDRVSVTYSRKIDVRDYSKHQASASITLTLSVGPDEDKRLKEAGELVDKILNQAVEYLDNETVELREQLSIEINDLEKKPKFTNTPKTPKLNNNWR